MSYNSGIPTVGILLPELLRHLPFLINDRKTVLGTAYQFEYFMEVLSKIYNIQPILEVFNSNFVNSSHKLIVHLCKSGLIKQIITTNFDTLLEQAFKKYRVPHQKNVRQINVTRQKNVIQLFKIHGDLENRDDLLIRLGNITDKENIERTEKILLSALNFSEYDWLIFCGYSFSDQYDINPVLKKFFKSTCKKVCLIDHIASTEVLSVKKENFLAFLPKNSFTIKCDTNILIEDLHDSMHSKYVSKPNTSTDGFHSKLTAWNSQILQSTPFVKYMMCGHILKSMGLHKRALFYYEKANKLASCLDEELLSRNNIVNVYLILGKTKVALKEFKILLEKRKKLKTPYNFILNLRDIASTLRQIGAVKPAVNYLKRALIMARKHKYENEVQNSLISLGNCYIGLKDYVTALSYFKLAIPYLKKRGDTSNNLLNSLSILACLIKLKKISEAEKLVEKIKIPIRTFGNTRYKILFQFNLGLIEFEKENYKAAIEEFNQSLKLSLSTKDTYFQYQILKDRAEAYFKCGKKSEALKDLRASKEIIVESYPQQKRILREINILMKRLAF